jgi:HD superfamily phosphohydrolase
MIMKLIKGNPSFSPTLPGIKAFLCAALLHDLGHFPFAHSLKELDLKNHESLTGSIILESDLAAEIKHSLDTDPLLVAAIIDRERDYRGSEDISFYRNLLSGVLDPDKLDYLNRDAYFCGIPYGHQDVDHIISDIHPFPEKGIAITTRGLASVESVLFAKYIMYKTVYWHKTVRIATAMIKKAILLGLQEGVISIDDLYGLNDQNFFAIADTIHFKPFRLLNDVITRNLYKQVFITAFSASHPSHCKLENLSERLSVETRIAKEIEKISGTHVSTEEIIIDIPERISFEIDVPVLHNDGEGNTSFKETGSVFNDKMVQNITQTLRVISLSVRRREEILKTIGKINITALIEG